MTLSPLVIARTPLRRRTKQSSPPPLCELRRGRDWLTGRAEATAKAGRIATPDSVGLAMTGIGHVFS